VHCTDHVLPPSGPLPLRRGGGSASFFQVDCRPRRVPWGEPRGVRVVSLSHRANWQYSVSVLVLIPAPGFDPELLELKPAQPSGCKSPAFPDRTPEILGSQALRWPRSVNALPSHCRPQPPR
jgi:hypothetical protein